MKKDCQSAWLAGQMKKTRVTAICGARSAYGSQAERNQTRSRSEAPPPGPFTGALAGGLLETAQQVVASPHRGVEGFLRRLVAGPDRLELLVDDGADLHEVPQPNALRVGRRLAAGHLLHRGIGPGVLLVEALLLGQLRGRRRDRQVAGGLVPFRLDLGRRQEGEEFRHTLVLVRLLAAHHPEA